MIKLITILFPLWAIIFSSVCYIFPDLVIGFKNLIIPLLMFIMFCMGITLKIDDFKRVLKNLKL